MNMLADNRPSSCEAAGWISFSANNTTRSCCQQPDALRQRLRQTCAIGRALMCTTVGTFAEQLQDETVLKKPLGQRMIMTVNCCKVNTSDSRHGAQAMRRLFMKVLQLTVCPAFRKQNMPCPARKTSKPACLGHRRNRRPASLTTGHTGDRLGTPEGRNASSQAGRLWAETS